MSFTKKYFQLLVLIVISFTIGSCSANLPDANDVQEEVITSDLGNDFALEEAAIIADTPEPISPSTPTTPPPTPTALPPTPTTPPPTPTALPPTPTTPPPTPTVPPPTPTLMPIGLSRANPYAPSDLVHAPNWDIRILDVVRGGEAWQRISSANMFNDPPREGMEYVLVNIYAKSTNPDHNETHSIRGGSFTITGDRKVRYSPPFVVAPSPQLDAQLYPGGETEGWVAFEISEGESDLILIVDELFNLDRDRIRFIALEEGARVEVSEELAGIEPTDIGVNRGNAAPYGEMITTMDWQIAIRDVVRGDDAWSMIQNANMFNDPPAAGMEYIVVKAYVRSINPEDQDAQIRGMYFKSTGAANVVYSTPFVVDPEPKLDARLYPGGEYEGWFVVQSAIGETDMKVIFEPLFDFSGRNTRFLSIQP
jgi:hypothetical protein